LKLSQTRLGLIGTGALALFAACSGSTATSQSGSGGAGGPAALGGAPGGGATGGAVGTTGTGGASGPAAGAGGSTAAGGATGAGAAGSTGSTGAGGSTATAPTLDQTGNPVYDLTKTYTGWLSTAAGDAAKLAADQTMADNMITWQLPQGGFYKNDKTVYAAPWDGVAPRSGWFGANNVELGTIDNSATATELTFLADVYRRGGVTKYRDSARKALEFLLTMQYPSGGFPQVYPARAGVIYSNDVTFNDDAMARVLVLLFQAAKQAVPFAGDLFTDDQRTRMLGAITGAVDYILKSQIVQAGVKTVWCAQHDQTTYVPRGARSYELPSKSGKESVGVITFLMTQPQTADVKAAVEAAIAWYKSPAVQVANTAYVSRPAASTDDTYDPIQTRSSSTMWYRFYDLDQDVGFFSGRLPTDNPPGVGKQYDIMQIEPERRYGYQWGGNYGGPLFTYATHVGY
jgi:PelA/Pel-15E family pectate lyase